MKQTIDLNSFRRAFEVYGRTDFTYEGLEVLFDYLERLEDDTGETIELGVIALCCEYSEDTLAEVASNCGLALDEDAVLVYLANNTNVCGTTDTHVVYKSF